MPKLSLIFPMAGQGARFGYRFKPFLDVNGRSFIEAAVAPFRAHLDQIDRIYFVFTHAQEEMHYVSAQLAELFPDLPFETAILPMPTTGPAETLRQCVVTKSITGPVLVCDCDHAVDVSGLLRVTEDPSVAGAVPTWSLEGEPISSWGVAAVASDYRIIAIREKALPECGDDFRGVIGCYYLSDIGEAMYVANATYLSDVLAHYIATGRTVLSVPVTQAHFFGDPARLARANVQMAAVPA